MNERFSRSEIERALRAADAPEDSMATEDDLIRHEGRAEAVEIFRDMLGLDGGHWGDASQTERHAGNPGQCSIRTCVAGCCPSDWCGPWRDGLCVDCGKPRRTRLRDEFSTERRETIIEALSWWEDSDGRWGHEKAREVLAAHESEWLGDA